MKKGQVGFNELIPWIIALGVFALVIVLYVVFNNKGNGLIDFLKNMWRFGS